MYLKSISNTGIIPVIKLTKIENSHLLAKALMDGGIDVAEVTFRAAGAAEVISRMTEAQPDMIIGAGTVTTVAQAEEAYKAGAKFIVSPGFEEEIVKWCVERELLVLPGCVTPTEIMAAQKLGVKTVKFFPAEQFGGLKTIKALGGPFGALKFVPTGGISLKNLDVYAAEPKIAACGGSFMATDKLLNEENFEEITALCKEARKIIIESRKEK